MTVITSEQVQKIRAAFWDPDSYLSVTLMDRYADARNLIELSGLSLETFLTAGKELLTDEDFAMADELEGF